MHRTILVSLLLLCVAARAEKDPKTVKVRLDANCTLHFLNGADARNALVESKIDPYFRLLSKADVECRLNKALPRSSQADRVEMLKKQYRAAVQPWSKDDIAQVQAACVVVIPIARRYSSRIVPKNWKFVVTDGTDESNMAYTRNDVIVLPRSEIHGVNGRPLAFLVAHETIHVFTRHNPKLRDALYQRLGFRRVGAIHAGDLAPRLLTNPDAPAVEHVIQVVSGEKKIDAVPMIYAMSDFKVAHPAGLLFYLRIGLFAVEDKGGKLRLGEPLAVGDFDRFFKEVRKVNGFLAQVGRNTRHVMHPEEVLAENLGHLLSGTPVRDQDPSGKKLMEDLGAILKSDQ